MGEHSNKGFAVIGGVKGPTSQKAFGPTKAQQADANTRKFMRDTTNEMSRKVRGEYADIRRQEYFTNNPQYNTKIK